VTGFLLLFGGIVALLWFIFGPEMGARPLLRKKPEGSPPDGDHQEQLTPTHLPTVISDLESRNPLSRAAQVRHSTSTAKGATEITRTNTDLIRAKGEEIETYLDKATSIAKKQEELRQVPVEMQAREQDLKARLAEARLKEAEADKKLKGLDNPPPAPKPEPPPKRALTDFEKRDEIRLRYDKWRQDVRARATMSGEQKRREIERLNQEEERELKRLDV
jgi:hypothetical protein